MSTPAVIRAFASMRNAVTLSPKRLGASPLRASRVFASPVTQTQRKLFSQSSYCM